MIELYSTDVTVASGSAIPFNNVALLLGCTTQRVDDAHIGLVKKGVYKVIFNADVTSTTTDEISVQLAINGTNVPQAVASVTPASIAASNHISFATLVKVANDVCGWCFVQYLAVMNTGADATFNNADIVVTKE